MRKKLLATVLAASMVLAMAPVLPASTGTVASAEEATVVEAVGTADKTAAWWTAFSSRYKLTGDFEAKFVMTNHSDMANVWNAVNYVFATADATSAADNADYKEHAVVRSDNWGWGGGDNKSLAGADIVYDGGIATAGDETFKEILKEAKFESTIKRSGDMVTISEVVTSVADATKSYTRTVTLQADTNDIYLFFVADASYIEINSVDIKNGEAGAATGSKFDAITTQPVVKYTFDAADELPLAGEAAIADGVLKLASTTTSFGKTYATLPDLSTNDFSNGITLTAEVNVANYASDWTPIFMLGDGTIGTGMEGATIAYHYTQGFSSREDVSGSGYFGSDANAPIIAPYAWDYFANEANRNQWISVAVSIASDKMTTYINGVEAQSLAGDYTNLLKAFNGAKNNYLGVSYWTNESSSADPDFSGSLDNVAIYNSALSAEDMAKVSALSTGSTTPSEPTTPTPSEPSDETPAAKKMTVKVTAKKNATKISGTVSVKKATVKVKVGKKAYKKATVNGKKFTLKCAKLTKGTKVTVKVTKSGYKAVTKTVKVK